MSDEVFTEEDAENDGLIKEEVGPKMAGNAKRNGGQLWRMFQKVCEHQGVEPKNLLGDGIVKALNDEDFAANIASVEVNMSEVQAGQLRIEDAKFVKELKNELDLDSGEDQFGWLNDVVQERIKSKTESPIPRFQSDRSEKEQQEVDRRLRRIEQNVEKMSRAVAEEADMEEVDDGESVDDLFDSGDDSGGDESGSGGSDGDNGEETVEMDIETGSGVENEEIVGSEHGTAEVDEDVSEGVDSLFGDDNEVNEGGENDEG